MNSNFDKKIMNAIPLDTILPIKENVINDLQERIMKAGSMGGILSYTQLVDGIDFGIDDVHFINSYNWMEDGHRTLIGAYLIHVIQRTYDESKCVITMIVTVQDSLQNNKKLLPSNIVKEWIYSLGGFEPNTPEAWEEFVIKQQNKTHRFCKLQRL